MEGDVFMGRKYCFCILCIALFLFSGCAGAHHAENGNVSNDAYAGEVNGTPQAVSGGENGVTEEAAKKLALDRVPGASTGDIREFKMDREDGHMEYEGKIIYDGMEYEFEIDAASGAFIEWEQEPAGH